MNFPNTQIPITYEALMASMYENDRFIREKFAETDRQIKETDRQMQKTDLKIEKLQELMGGWSNSHGSFAEEYFYNSFENGDKNFFGENFDEIEKNLKPKNIKLKDEYDIVMYNHNAVAIVEVKFKARVKDIPMVIKKAETFRILCPDYKDFKIYLALASLSFGKELEKQCLKQGIAVIKQVGETVVIHDAHLKLF
jgi:hypothetical protein